jgi:hypothetical protein
LIGFSAYKLGHKIVPCNIKSNPGIEPVDYAWWNFGTLRLKQNQLKYTQNQELKALLPYLAIGGIIIMFILGSYFWGKHVENVATMILQQSEKFFMKAAEVSGAVQVIGG